MKASNNHATLSTTSGSFLDDSTCAFDTHGSEDQVLKSIDTLEVKLYRMFADVERRLDECERQLLSAVKRSVEELRVTNIESMEAVQLDLECLRQRVNSHGLELSEKDPTAFLDELCLGSVIRSRFAIDPDKVSQLINSLITVDYKLPSACLNIHSNDAGNMLGECVLFDMQEQRDSVNGESAVPFAEVLQSRENCSDTEYSEDLDEDQSAEETPRPTPKEEKSGFFTPSRLLISSLCAVSIGAVVHFTLKRLGSH